MDINEQTIINKRVKHKEYKLGIVIGFFDNYKDGKSVVEIKFEDGKVKKFYLNAFETGTLKIVGDQSNVLLKYKEDLTAILDSIVKDPSITTASKTRLIIHTTSIVCALVAVQPIPFADVFILTPIQVVMVTYLNKVIGNPFEKSDIKEIVTYLMGVVGWGVLAQQAVLGVYKTIIPFMGAITTIPLVYAATYALGTGAKIVLEAQVNNENYSKEQLKEVIKEAKKSAKQEVDFQFTIKSLKHELESVKKQANKYTTYKQRLLEVEKLLQLEREKRTTDELPTMDIVEIYEKQLLFLKNRFQKSYGEKLWVQDSIFYSLTLLPSEAMQRVEHEISQLLQGQIHKLKLREINTNEFELQINGIGTCYLYKANNKFLFNYLEVEGDLQKKYPYIQMTSQERHKHIKNEEIRTYFEKAIKDVKEELLIISPWISDQVVDGLQRDIEEAVNRGVTIKIVYGYSGDRLKNSREAGRKLEKKFGSKIELVERNTHYKLVICDEKFYLMGSMNFLSFGGNYSNGRTRDEGAIYCNSRDEIVQLRNMYFT